MSGHSSQPAIVSASLHCNFFVWGLLSAVILNLDNTAKHGGLPLAGDVKDYRLDRVDHGLSSLPQREDAHTEGAEKQP